jgi:hypothetical protein
MNSSVIVAQSESEKLVCNTTGIAYTPDVLRHRYGESKRRPLEDWFLDELRFFETMYPEHKIFTLGSSLVFGEKFITYLTVCEFDIKNEEHFSRLVEALRASDRAIRRKMSAMWKWDIAARRDKSIVFMVGWLDFAYFLQHRSDFLNKTHGHYMGSFISDQSAIKSKDYKVLHDGTIASFDHEKLSSEDDAVYKNYNAIQYERVSTETLV